MRVSIIYVYIYIYSTAPIVEVHDTVAMLGIWDSVLETTIVSELLQLPLKLAIDSQLWLCTKLQAPSTNGTFPDLQIPQPSVLVDDAKIQYRAS